MVQLLKGWASKPERDAEAHLVQLRALTWDKLPPLLLEHEEKNVAGKIIKLEWRSEGLWIECEAEDRYANRPAFSCRFAVREHEIQGFGRAAIAIVKRAKLVEVSLVSRPACKTALVVSSEAVSAPAVPDPGYAELAERKRLRDIEFNTLMAEWQNQTARAGR